MRQDYRVDGQMVSTAGYVEESQLSLSRGGVVSYTTAPPDASDFPALTPTSLNPPSLNLTPHPPPALTSYASQAQVQVAASAVTASAQPQAANANATSSSTLPQPPPHLAHLQQAPGATGAPVAPPGLGAGQAGMTNGQLEAPKTEDFPALNGPGKDVS